MSLILIFSTRQAPMLIASVFFLLYHSYMYLDSSDFQYPAEHKMCTANGKKHCLHPEGTVMFSHPVVTVSRCCRCGERIQAREGADISTSSHGKYLNSY